MNIHYDCLPCLVNQFVRVAELTGARDRDALFRKVFRYLSGLDFAKSNPEVIGAAFELLKEHTGNDDPYRETRAYYNRLFLGMLDDFEKKIEGGGDPLRRAVSYAILGNVIDFNPMHSVRMEDILRRFEDADRLTLAIDHLDRLAADLGRSRTLLYLGDNCGEICLDKLLIQKIRERYPGLTVWFGVRGKPVVNDSVEEDAHFVGMDAVARVIGNGDNSLGTVLPRVSEAFRRVYDRADVVIAKGQANYESLSGESGKNRYFLLMVKCAVISGLLGVPQQSAVCLNAAAAQEDGAASNAC